MIIFTVCVLYHTKTCVCCRKKTLPDVSANKPDQSPVISPKQQCPDVLPPMTPPYSPYSKRKESGSSTSYEENSLEHIELQEMSPFTEISVIACTKKNKVWLGEFTNKTYFEQNLSK